MFDPAGDMDKRKKYFRAVTVAVLLVVLSGYGKNFRPYVSGADGQNDRQ